MHPSQMPTNTDGDIPFSLDISQRGRSALRTQDPEIRLGTASRTHTTPSTVWDYEATPPSRPPRDHAPAPRPHLAHCLRKSGRRR